MNTTMSLTLQPDWQNGRMRQAISHAISQLPTDVLPELANFIDSLRLKKTKSFAEVFGHLDGQIVYNEDINTPTAEEWGDLNSNRSVPPVQ